MNGKGLSEKEKKQIVDAQNEQRRKVSHCTNDCYDVFNIINKNFR